jgi:hypothetical protein
MPGMLCQDVIVAFGKAAAAALALAAACARADARNRLAR